jgi:GDP-mannose transporter
MIYTASKSLQYLSVAMFTVFKNVTIILIAVSEYKLFKTRLGMLKWISFGAIVGSSIVGGYNDLNFNWIGYTWMLINCLSSAMFGIGMRMVIRKVQFEDFDSVFFNNAIAIPIIFILSIVMEDWKGFFSTM